MCRENRMGWKYTFSRFVTRENSGQSWDLSKILFSRFVKNREISRSEFKKGREGRTIGDSREIYEEVRQVTVERRGVGKTDSYSGNYMKVAR